MDFSGKIGGLGGFYAFVLLHCVWASELSHLSHGLRKSVERPFWTGSRSLALKIHCEPLKMGVWGKNGENVFGGKCHPVKNIRCANPRRLRYHASKSVWWFLLEACQRSQKTRSFYRDTFLHCISPLKRRPDLNTASAYRPSYDK